MEGTGKVGTEEGSSAGGFGHGDVFGGALGDDFTTRFTAFGAEVHEVVGLGEDIEVVLNHHHGVSGLHQSMKKID